MSRRRTPGETPEPRRSFQEKFEFESDEWLRNVLLGIAAVAPEPKHGERYRRMAGSITAELDRGARGTSAHAVFQASLRTVGGTRLRVRVPPNLTPCAYRPRGRDSSG